MKLLAIDTSTEACSAAIMLGGEIIEKYEVAPRKHAELILPMVEQLLADSGNKLAALDALAFGRGPGAFTGVRIATGVIQGLAYGADLPVIPVSSLAALAQGAAAQGNAIVSAIDARMGEVYWGLFRIAEDGIACACSEESVSKPEQVQITEYGDWFGAGSGWASYSAILMNKLGDAVKGYDGSSFPRAAAVLKIAVREFTAGKAVAAEQALPVYLRNRVTG